MDIFWGPLLNWIIFMCYFFKLSALAMTVFCDEIYTNTHLKRHLNMIWKVHYRIFIRLH